MSIVARNGQKDHHGTAGRPGTGADGTAVILRAPLTGAAELVAESVAASSGQRAHPAASRPVVDVSLVIPAKNEARNLAWVLERVPPCVNEIILVDGDSRDATQAMAEFCWPDIRIVRQDVPGKGSALRAGFSAATGEIIVMIDADGSMSPEEIPHFVWVLEHGYDFVKGSRFVAGGGSLDITPVRRLGNRGLLAMVNALYDSQLTDLCYGFCAFRRRWLPSLNLTASGFEIETEMTIRALRAGLRVTEVASLELPRRSGRSGLRAVRDGLRVLQTVIDDRRRPFGLDGRPGLNPSSTAAAVPGGHR